MHYIFATQINVQKKKRENKNCKISNISGGVMGGSQIRKRKCSFILFMNGFIFFPKAHCYCCVLVGWWVCCYIQLICFTKKLD